MPDYLPFERVSYSKPSAASISEAVWIWFIWSSTPLSPNFSAEGNLYTIPSGYKGVISDIVITTEYRGETAFWIPNGDNILYVTHDAFIPVSISFQLPPVANSGETINVRTTNNDIVAGNFRLNMTMWLVPGSKPEKPKKDDPEERFRLGDFSSANVIFLPDNETLYLFRKRDENKMNYLRFKDYAKPNQKVLAKLHLKPEEAQEIIEISRTKPEKLIETLKKYEEKYGKKKAR
jgi:hypothetical protein